jgi:zinc transport system substrate-binding protein
LLILNGASYEQWLSTVSLPRSRQLDTSKIFAERLIALEGSMTHSHGTEGEHEHTGTAFTTWLDLSLALEQARAILSGLAKKWPEHASQFETRFKELEQELLTLDTSLQEVVSHAPETPVVFSHPVYQYFEQRYGVNGKSLHWEPHDMPDDTMWQGLETLLQEHPAQWMIWEGEPLPEIVAKLKEFSVESVVYDPCGNIPDEGDFLSVMHTNVASLQQVFETD